MARASWPSLSCRSRRTSTRVRPRPCCTRNPCQVPAQTPWPPRPWSGESLWSSVCSRKLAKTCSTRWPSWGQRATSASTGRFIRVTGVSRSSSREARNHRRSSRRRSAGSVWRTATTVLSQRRPGCSAFRARTSWCLSTTRAVLSGATTCSRAAQRTTPLSWLRTALVRSGSRASTVGASSVHQACRCSRALVPQQSRRSMPIST